MLNQVGVRFVLESVRIAHLLWAEPINAHRSSYLIIILSDGKAIENPLDSGLD